MVELADEWENDIATMDQEMEMWRADQQASIKMERLNKN